MDQSDFSPKQGQMSFIESNQANNEINLIIIESNIKSDGVGKYILYTIQGSEKNHYFRFKRRYQDFYQFRNILVNRWPGCFIPPLPPKKKIGNFQSDFVEKRKKQLQAFLKKLAEINYLWFSKEAVIFRSYKVVNTEIEFNSLPNQIYSEIIEKYENAFNHLSGSEIDLELLEKIDFFQKYINNLLQMITNFKITCTNMIKAKNKNNDQLGILLNFFLPQYEKYCFSNMMTAETEKKIFYNNENPQFYNLIIYSINARQNQLLKQNEFESYLFHIKELKLQLNVKHISSYFKAFQECFLQKSLITSQAQEIFLKYRQAQLQFQDLQSGKQNLKQVLKLSSKTQLLEQQQKKIENVQLKIESETSQFLNDLIIIILGYEIMPQFQKRKLQEYGVLLEQLANFEYQYQTIVQSLWGDVLDILDKN